MVWIPAHTGLKHNDTRDTADKLAKDATLRTAININICMELNDVYDIAKNYCIKKMATNLGYQQRRLAFPHHSTNSNKQNKIHTHLDQGSRTN